MGEVNGRNINKDLLGPLFFKCSLLLDYMVNYLSNAVSDFFTHNWLCDMETVTSGFLFQNISFPSQGLMDILSLVFSQKLFWAQ